MTKIHKAFAFASGSFKGVYSFGIWDRLFYNIATNYTNKGTNKISKCIDENKFMFSGSSIGALGATKAYYDLNMLKNGKNYNDIKTGKDVNSSQFEYYKLMNKVVGNNIYAQLDETDCSDKPVKNTSTDPSAQPQELIKIMTNNNYTVNPVYLVLQGIFNILTLNGALFVDTKKNDFIKQYITHHNGEKGNSIQVPFKIDKYNKEDESNRTELRVSTTDLSSSKSIIFGTDLDKNSKFNNNSISFKCNLNDSNLNQVLFASSSIPVMFNPIKAYLVNNDTEITFNTPASGSASNVKTLLLQDGGVSTDFCTGSLFDDILEGRYEVDQLIICDVENYYSMFDYQTNTGSGLFNVLSKLLDSYDKYVKYNDLLQVVASSAKTIDQQLYNVSVGNDDKLYITKIISTYDGTKFTTQPTEYYVLDAKYFTPGLKEIIYVGSTADIGLTSIVTNQSTVLDVIPKMYEQGLKVGQKLFNECINRK